MFSAIVLAIHVIVCVTLVLIILLQSGKGASIGAVFGGGGSNTLFGSTGASTFLSKVTIAAAVTFMLTSITLSYFAGRNVPVDKSIMSEQSETGAKSSSKKAPESPTKDTGTKESGGEKESTPTTSKGSSQPSQAGGGATGTEKAK